MYRQRLFYPCLFAFILLSVLSPLGRLAHAQVPTGKEFVITLPALVPIAERNDTTIQFSFEVYCSRVTTINVKWRDGSSLASNVIITAGNKMLFTKPLLQMLQIVQPYENNSPNDNPNDRSLIVTADQPVSVHVTYGRPHETETYTAIPTSAYGTKYTVGTYAGFSALGDRSGFSVIAREDGTVLTINPTQRARFSHVPGSPYTITLNRFQVYTSNTIDPMGYPIADLTGTTISATKPVGLVTFSAGTNVPWIIPDTIRPHPQLVLHFFDGGWSAKPLIEMQMPDSAAGTVFYTAPFKRQKWSVVRLIGLADSTRIDSNLARLQGPDKDFLLMKGMVAEFRISEPTKFETSKPVIAMQLAVSGDTANVDSTITVNGRDTTVRLMYGDPMQVMLYPVSQYKPALQWITPILPQRQALPRAPQIPFYWEHFVLITAPVAAANGGVRLDGQPVTFTERHIDNQYVTAVVPIGPRAHILESDLPISAIPYGFTLNDSYSTSAAEALRSVAKLGLDTLRFITCGNDLDTTFTIQNLGNNVFRIDSIRATGLDVKVLTPSTYPQAYIPQATGQITIVVKVPQPGTYTGTLRIYTDANNRAVFEVPIIAIRDSARLAIPGSAIDFGVMKGAETQRDTVLKIRNDGVRPLVLQAPTLTGTGFQVISPKGPITIPPGGVDSIVVRFIPNGEGLRQGTIRLNGAPCLTPITMTLSGFKGGGASVQVQRTVNYSSYLCVVPASVDSTLVLKSIGDEPVTITTATIGGTNQDEFALVEDLTNKIVLPGDSLVFHVRYLPKGYGYRSAAVVLTTTAANAPTITIDLSARRDTAGLAVSLSSLSFGQRTPCEGEGDSVLVLTNTGTVPDTITALDLGGASGYVLDPMPSQANPIIIYPNGTQPIRVRFTASDAGSYAATLKITSQPCDVSSTVALSADRITPSLIADAMTMEFDTLYGCQQSVTRKVKLTNNGPVPDTVYSSSIAGSPSFSYASPGQLIIPPGESRTIDVTFSAVGNDAQLAELTLGWKPCDAPMKINLQGHVYQTSAAFASTSLEYGQVQIATPTSRRVWLKNTGSAPRRVMDLSVPAGLRIVKPTLPAVIAPNDSVEIEVEWTLATPGTYSENLTATIGEPCGTSLTLPLNVEAIGEDILPVSLTLTVPHTTGTVDQRSAIPVLLSDGVNLSGATSMHVRLRYRYTMFDPERVTTSIPGMTATLSQSKIDGDDRIVDIDLAGGTLPVSGELVRLEGLTLLGDQAGTAVVIDSVGIAFPSPAPFERVTVRTQDGDFELVGYCVTGGDRLVMLDGALKINVVRPNPFRGGTTIEYETTESGPVELSVLDVTGSERLRLDQGVVDAGVHQVKLDAGDLSSGLYICQLRKGALIQRVTIILVQ